MERFSKIHLTSPAPCATMILDEEETATREGREMTAVVLGVAGALIAAKLIKLGISLHEKRRASWVLWCDRERERILQNYS